MTTDIVPKAVSKQISLDGTTVTITGIAKGSGMIHPNMATMLSYIGTDAALSQPLLEEIVRHAADNSLTASPWMEIFQPMTLLFLLAQAMRAIRQSRIMNSTAFAALQDAVTEVAVQLAQSIVRDGEGATKFITVRVEGGKTPDECSKVAYAIAHSPLVKTAFFASDPNLGRILAAIGYAGLEELDVNRLQLYLDDVLVAENGGRACGYREQMASE